MKKRIIYFLLFLICFPTFSNIKNHINYNEIEKNGYFIVAETNNRLEFNKPIVEENLINIVIDEKNDIGVLRDYDNIFKEYCYYLTKDKYTLPGQKIIWSKVEEGAATFVLEENKFGIKTIVTFSTIANNDNLLLTTVFFTNVNEEQETVEFSKKIKNVIFDLKNKIIKK